MIDNRGFLTNGNMSVVETLNDSITGCYGFNDAHPLNLNSIAISAHEKGPCGQVLSVVFVHIVQLSSAMLAYHRFEQFYLLVWPASNLALTSSTDIDFCGARLNVRGGPTRGQDGHGSQEESHSQCFFSEFGAAISRKRM